jgi:hypothetical protein
VFLNSDGDELSADEEQMVPRPRSGSPRTVNGNVYRMTDGAFNLRRRVLTSNSELRLSQPEVSSTETRYFGTSEPFYVDPLPLPLVDGKKAQNRQSPYMTKTTFSTMAAR